MREPLRSIGGFAGTYVAAALAFRRRRSEEQLLGAKASQQALVQTLFPLCRSTQAT